MFFADLLGKHVLVIEDDYLQASALRITLEEQGSEVIGPYFDIDDGLAALDLETVDAAVLDVRINAKEVFPLADRLAERGVPFIFVTGYNRNVLPVRFDRSRCVLKPLMGDDIAVALTVSILDSRTMTGATVSTHN